ncbi:MAG: BamA/TamA family outer membrane protein [Bdellovibrionaceae bacterium]|nr:BamA/TamA family outer membrane protein [Pseudobdellovibrionaceae bacterium]
MSIKFYLFFFILLNSIFAKAQYITSEKDSELVHKYLKKKSHHLTLSEINTILKNIAISENIESAQAVLDKTIHFEMSRIGNSQKVVINGNQALTESEIISILGTDKLSRISKEELERTIPKLKERYEAIGLRSVQFNLNEETTSDTNIYTLDINEGSSVKLEDIIILSPDKNLNSAIHFSLSEYMHQTINKTLLREIEQKVSTFLIDSRMLNAKITKISPIYNQERTAAKLTISLESIDIYEFIFDGNHYFSSGNIVSNFNLAENYLNYVKNPNLLQKDIETLYRKNGFSNVVVSVDTIRYDNLHKIIYVFYVKEGSQFRIDNIVISGKITRPPSYYQEMIRENLAQMNNSNLYIKENVDKAIEKVAMDLKNQGYLRAEAVPLNYKVDSASTVNIHVQINENMLTQIRDIQFVGIQHFTSNQLHDVIDLKPNSTLNLIKVYDSFTKLKTFYQKNGYLEFKIKTPPENLIRYLDNYEFADLKYEISEGPQVIVKDIKVVGNNFTKEHVILRELDLEKGMVLTSDIINDSVVFLERTQLFSRAQITTSDTDTNVRERTVIVEVQEKNPGLFSSGIGVSNDRGITLRGNAGISYQNLKGTGRGVSARGDIRYSLDPRLRYPENRIVLGYYEPYLFFNRLRGRVSLIREQQIFSVTTDLQKVIIQENNEVSFLLEKQLTRKLKVLWNAWNLSSLATFDKNITDKKDRVQIGTIGPSLEYDRRDDTFVPRDGTFTNAAMEYSSPLLGSSANEISYIEYFRATAGHLMYTPLNTKKTWVFVNDFRAGFLENLSDKAQSGIPATKLFYLGGRSTLRGYDLRRDERVPSLREICYRTGQSCQTITDFKLKTQSYFYLLKAEIRFPLYNSIGGSFFYDGGAVFIKNINIEDHYRDTAGFGLRYVTPIGALTAEIGFKLDKKSGSAIYNDERPYTVHISIGSF